MKKSLRKLLPTIAMVLVTAALMGTSTFAWFTMNTSVTVNGMKVHVDTYDNLLVAPDTDSKSSNAESAFVNNITLTAASNIELAPVSTVDGKTFFYVDNDEATAAGNVSSSAYKAYEESAFQAQYGTSSGLFNKKVGYVDYNFQLKAINGDNNGSGSDELKLGLTALTLRYTGSESEAARALINAFRVAIFMEEKVSKYPTNSGDTPHVDNFVASHAVDIDSSSILKSIYAPSGAAHFDAGKAVKASGSSGVLSTVTYSAISSSGNYSTLAENDVKYYKVTVRIWLEGEDKSCNNEAFVLLDSDWELSLGFTLATSVTNVTNLSMVNSSGT